MVEFVEEEEEHHSVEANPPDEGLGVVAVYKQELEGVDHNEYELEHLECSQVLLPPEIRLYSGTQSGHEVVGVHDDMDERVQEAEES